MNKNKIYILTDHQNRNPVFKLFSFEGGRHFDQLQRNQFYSLIWIKEGDGVLKVDFSEYAFQKNTLFSFTPYQPFMFSESQKLSGVALQYHADFYCIHRDEEETNCDTVIFNNIYQAPFVGVDRESERKLDQTLEQLEQELKNEEYSDRKLLIPYLKIFLITASRIKPGNKFVEPRFSNPQTPLVLRELQNAIGDFFKEKHNAGDYAMLLNIPLNTLAKLVKTHFNKTLTNLITERIIIEAKRELYLTSRSVKEIAWKLGYPDEFYFSRLFKKWAGISPKVYRETVGFGKAELTSENS
ncbi:AraC family transcriptional regulator [Mucilaginibacter sp. PPCGB 2223]|uniref:helix-turn-helix domain-containing protein n=1 Tax=Mucilaginibacter sp. PPCGB 2223 TaxID=1886027 RepID=UPI000826A68E|nr:helix-turn-helix domain-containing protein [Mucilaginibacter sp. PPCGB 2223]OCX50902.1 AraC family transcriptional regulator [Mucilaginibacter sp. PPCGB 2223]